MPTPAATPENPSALPVALLIGASRGIGRQLAISLATNRSTPYFVVVSSKTTSPPGPLPQPFVAPDPNSPQSTIDTVAHEIALLGGKALALACDVRNTSAVAQLVDATVRRLGRLDVLVYNSGAIWWSSVSGTPPKRFELMWEVNVRGCYAAVSAALPHLSANPIPVASTSTSTSTSPSPSPNVGGGGTGGGSGTSEGGQRGDGKGHGRIIVICPPIYSRFFRGKTAYAMTKVGMSVLVRGLAMDFTRMRNEADTGFGLAVTGLWPAVSIESAATERAVKSNQDVRRDLRTAEIFGDAVLEILNAPVANVNGRLLLDEDWLRHDCRYTDARFESYNLVPGANPRRIMPRVLPSLEVAEQDDEGRRMDSAKL